MRLFSTFSCLAAILLFNSVRVSAADAADAFAVFKNGKLAGTAGPGIITGSSGLIYANSASNRLTIRLADRDISKYDFLNITFTSNRTGDQFRLTATSNPPDAQKWNYYFDRIRTITSQDRQTIRFALRGMNVSRNPVGWHDIQSFELCFAGWDMPFQRGLILTVEEITLSADAEARRKEEAQKTRQLKAKADVERILPLFPMKAWIPVPPASNRAWWNAKRQTVYARNLLNKHIAKALAAPPKMPSAERYMDFLNNGNRSRYEAEYTPIRQNFANLTMALCLTGDRDKYLPAWIAHAEILAAMRTWVFPAHDRDLRNWSGRNPSLELVGTEVAAGIMQARLLLKGWIPEDLDRRLAAQVQRQILDPFLNTVKGKRPHDWFVVAENNWNSVCFANLLRTVLASDLPDADKRAAIEYTLVHVRNYLAGFRKDGYCSEGISYWTYGYGYYLILAATVYSATDGKVNLLDEPKARLAAEFPHKFMLSAGYFPAFSDCYFAAGVSDVITYLMNYLLKKPVESADRPAGNMNYQLAVWGLPPVKGSSIGPENDERVSGFPETGVYVFRSPNPGALRLALKGGNNGEFHNHNDLGSYALSYPERLSVLGDVGKAEYTRDSFNVNRYNNPILNSYGHPVPVVGGKLQGSGEECSAQVKQFRHDSTAAEVVLDLRKGYPAVSGLKVLERSFRYRFADGETVIADTAELVQPETFEVALITFGIIEKQPDGSLLAKYGTSAVRIEVNTSGVPWTLKKEALSGNASWRDQPWRYAVVPEGKRTSWKIEMTFRSVK